VIEDELTDVGKVPRSHTAKTMAVARSSNFSQGSTWALRLQH